MPPKGNKKVTKPSNKRSGDIDLAEANSTTRFTAC